MVNAQCLFTHVMPWCDHQIIPVQKHLPLLAVHAVVILKDMPSCQVLMPHPPPVPKQLPFLVIHTLV